MGRIKTIAAKAKRLWPIWKAIEVGDTLAGLWDRLPAWMREWIWRAVLVPVAFAIWTFVSRWVGEWRGFLTENWGWALLAGALLAAITWAIVEGARYRLMSRRVHLAVEEGVGVATVIKPAYVSEDAHQKEGEPPPKEPLSLDIQGIRWVHDGFRKDSDMPRVRPTCPQHGAPVNYRVLEASGVLDVVRSFRPPRDEDRIGDVGFLICIADAQAHEVRVPVAKRSLGVTFGDLRRAAEARMQKLL